MGGCASVRGGPRERLARPVPFLRALRRQRHNARLLQHLQQAQAGRDTVLAGGGVPAQVLAERLRQFLAAQCRKRRYGLLDLGNLPAREALAEKGGGLEMLDAGIHGRSQETSSRLPWQIRPRMLRGVS